MKTIQWDARADSHQVGDALKFPGSDWTWTVREVDPLGGGQARFYAESDANGKSPEPVTHGQATALRTQAMVRRRRGVPSLGALGPHGDGRSAADFAERVAAMKARISE